MWKVLMVASLDGVGSLTVDVLEGGVGVGEDAKVVSLFSTLTEARVRRAIVEVKRGREEVRRRVVEVRKAAAIVVLQLPAWA